MVIEIVDLPSYKMVIFYSYVSLPEGTGGYLMAQSDAMISLGSSGLIQQQRQGRSARGVAPGAQLRFNFHHLVNHR